MQQTRKIIEIPIQELHRFADSADNEIIETIKTDKMDLNFETIISTQRLLEQVQRRKICIETSSIHLVTKHSTFPLFHLQALFMPRNSSGEFINELSETCLREIYATVTYLPINCTKKPNTNGRLTESERIIHFDKYERFQADGCILLETSELIPSHMITTGINTIINSNHYEHVDQNLDKKLLLTYAEKCVQNSPSQIKLATNNVSNISNEYETPYQVHVLYPVVTLHWKIFNETHALGAPLPLFFTNHELLNKAQMNIPIQVLHDGIGIRRRLRKNINDFIDLDKIKTHDKIEKNKKEIIETNFALRSCAFMHFIPEIHNTVRIKVIQTRRGNIEIGWCELVDRKNLINGDITNELIKEEESKDIIENINNEITKSLIAKSTENANLTANVTADPFGVPESTSALPMRIGKLALSNRGDECGKDIPLIRNVLKTNGGLRSTFSINLMTKDITPASIFAIVNNEVGIKSGDELVIQRTQVIGPNGKFISWSLSIYKIVHSERQIECIHLASITLPCASAREQITYVTFWLRDEGDEIVIIDSC